MLLHLYFGDFLQARHKLISKPFHARIHHNHPIWQLFRKTRANQLKHKKMKNIAYVLFNDFVYYTNAFFYIKRLM